ncbi:hypothetical protein TONV_028 [Tipula oleracea nudivirus]|uniref:Uncharacterized protein n=1 Tax=Tipula oleracea nudivirus TaxID=1546257 RepID=A0A0B4VGJ6_9VIRU|nr:hypothetical protein TONV_028 [Tipula oleracea nudivirus]AJD20088.1 hypothetical protein TONV_028 [Tipula oleracea nudivirus]
MANVNARQQTRMGTYLDPNCSNLSKQASTMSLTGIIFGVITIILLVTILILNYGVKTDVMGETIKLKHIGWISVASLIAVIISTVVLGIIAANSKKIKQCINASEAQNNIAQPRM